jgi:uncharacterized protein YggE
MIRHYIALAIVFLIPAACFAQASGNIGFSQGGASGRAEQSERAKRVLPKDDQPPNGTSMFVDASVLMNVTADEYVAVFGVAQEGATIAECMEKMDATIRSFQTDLKLLGVPAVRTFVDYIGQNKTYGFEITGDVAKERLVGFELKKNVSIHFSPYSLLDKLIAAAARSQIFDLIKVDYLVKDTPAVQNRVMEEASRIIRQKAARYERLLGVRLHGPAQVYIDRPATYFPSEMYDSYVASESEDVSSGSYRQKYIVQGARKGRTFFFNGLSARGFDSVVHPVILEPVVQFTLYLKVKYGIDPARTREASATTRKK